MLKHWDDRRDVCLPGDESKTIGFAVDHWLSYAKRAIEHSGRFVVALSGGSTPRVIFEKLAEKEGALDWGRVWLFWSDERAVGPDSLESNYFMAMQSGLGGLPIPKDQIFRMKAEKEIEKGALEYEKTIRKVLQDDLFDLVMLGLGDDGHTASLFPETNALGETERLVVANEVKAKKTWRMTFTFRCINESKSAVIYALGESKKTIVKKVLTAQLPSPWPASFVGTASHKALWILDDLASQELFPKIDLFSPRKKRKKI